MPFDPERAEIRFGCGLSARHAPPASPAEMLARLTGPDEAARRYPVGGFDHVLTLQTRLRDTRRAARKDGSEAAFERARETRRSAIRALRREAAPWYANVLLRRADGTDGLRERLVQFWGDHFTAVGQGAAWHFAAIPYAEEAIRPHVAGRFSDLLRAAVTHPLMLRYLDQAASVGPDSVKARNSKRLSGLNENLARELLELHTLGADGPYTQRDVQELARLLTGLSFDLQEGFRFRPNHAQPGPETVLGQSYGGAGRARLEDIHALLDELAVHPATAAHLCRKLAVHFVADRPDPRLIEAMTTRYRETGGALTEVYAAMLDHPSAWDVPVGNVKQPIDFIGSALRALDPGAALSKHARPREMNDLFLTPLRLMGQTWGQPLGPDGWPEADEDWITPQRLAARLNWAMQAPVLFLPTLPDPRDLARVAFGRTLPPRVAFAARAAETRAEGVGLVLASAAFQRM
ncbi:hypothetical protein RA2_00067 [Roseovarius sp. A-2]|uniref:DUF1800 domain-containing protein n=1 Tax=Roseovarius sp. A-2 TaxID=1570360 RepID=UPI0009B5458E|nr:DUF1800 domain-containing protein [Roseovarius sp. A-2]GAW33031.1 hypothetical protein RA2_00067 [Roseovarius sp. A-2]